jgi:hypothetical protein
MIASLRPCWRENSSTPPRHRQRPGNGQRNVLEGLPVLRGTWPAGKDSPEGVGRAECVWSWAPCPIPQVSSLPLHFDHKDAEVYLSEEAQLESNLVSVSEPMLHPLDDSGEALRVSVPRDHMIRPGVWVERPMHRWEAWGLGSLRLWRLHLGGGGGRVTGGDQRNEKLCDKEQGRMGTPRQSFSCWQWGIGRCHTQGQVVGSDNEFSSRQAGRGLGSWARKLGFQNNFEKEQSWRA